MRSSEEVGLVIPRHTVDIPVVIKTFKFSLTADLDQVDDDGNEDHNCIVSLFII